ncbi:MAG: hypothetical protein IPL46_01030 [Saprospiraceae bacterium]|nr:hypothetical protein [Saprospiraceae bacterium]
MDDLNIGYVHSDGLIDIPGNLLSFAFSSASQPQLPVIACLGASKRYIGILKPTFSRSVVEQLKQRVVLM